MTTQSKSVINQDLILAARQGLLPAAERAWLGGFGNMLGKELNQWWRTRTWWVQTLISGPMTLRKSQACRISLD